MTGLGKLTRPSGGSGRIAFIKELGVSDTLPARNEDLTVEISQAVESSISSSVALLHTSGQIIHATGTLTIQRCDRPSTEACLFGS